MCGNLLPAISTSSKPKFLAITFHYGKGTKYA